MCVQNGRAYNTLTMLRLLLFGIFLCVFPGTNGALVNVAYLKKTDQSSVWNGGSGGYSHNAVDGCYETHWDAANCGCTATDHQSDPWWSVDLGLMSTVHKVQVTNRGDCCEERLADFNLWVMSDNMAPALSTNKVLCAHKTGAVANSASEMIYCDAPVTGVYMTLEIPGSNKLVTLCEVEVWADDHSHWGTIFNYATSRSVYMTNDVTRDYTDNPVSSTMVDNDHATCPDRLVAGDTSGIFTIDLTHRVAVSKVRVHQSSSCEYYCSTRIDIQGFGNDDPDRTDYIRINGTDTNDGYDTSSRGWNIVVLDECGCTIKDRFQVDHYAASQQVGCMTNADGFTPSIQAMDDGDIVIGVSEDEVHDGVAACYSQGLDLLNVQHDDYGFRASVVFIAKKGFPEFTQRQTAERYLGPSSIAGVYVGAAPLHSFTAGMVTSSLASSFADTCGSYNGLVGRGDVAVLECTPGDLPVGRLFQLSFPAVGVHFCEIEIYLGNMAEFCEDDGDKCFYIPSRRWGSAAQGQWECRTQYAHSTLAEVDASEWELARSHLTSDSNLEEGLEVTDCDYTAFIGDIPDSSLSASSLWDSSHGPQRSKFNVLASDGGGTGGWSSAQNTVGQYIQADLGTVRMLAVIATRGRNAYNQWVTSYHFAYSRTGPPYEYITNVDGSETVFSGNSDADTIVEHEIEPIAARYVRLYPRTWTNHISMRWEVYGCEVDNVNLMSGIVSSSDSWRYYESDAAAPSSVTSGQSTANHMIYMQSSGDTSSTTDNAMQLFPLCEISKSMHDGTQHVAMRVPAYASLGSSLHAMWTGSSPTPSMDTPITTQHVSYDVTVDEIFKSPIVDCVWDFVKEVRVSLYKQDVEVAFLNFQAPSGSSKSDFFSYTNLVGSTWVDMFSYTPSATSLSGYTGSSTRRRWLFEKASGGCGDTEHAWFMVLDTDHSSCASWDDDSALPKFLYSDSTENHYEAGPDLNSADLFVTTIRMDDTAFGGACVSSCVGVIDGQYHSCIGCNVYATCASDVLTYGVCMNGMKWHASSLGSGVCQHVSYSCSDRDAVSSCNPNGCSSSPCQNGATCSMAAAGGWQCACVSGWEGGDCSSEVDECLSGPCQNGATCNEEFDGYMCACSPGFEGSECQTNTDECASSPCQNSGTCHDQVNSYSCTCATGWQDALCQTNTNECASDPCQNGATCNDAVNSFTCSCASGWQQWEVHESSDCGGNDWGRQTYSTAEECLQHCINDYSDNGCVGVVFGGTSCFPKRTCSNITPLQNYDTYTLIQDTLCNVEIDECFSNPCQNGASCNDYVNYYECGCDHGYEGTNCETNTNECASSPCQNGGTCNDQVNQYTCTCAPGWQDQHCQTDTDECISEPCQHAGTCTDFTNYYMCACFPGYTGDECQTDINECASNPCQNGATCNDAVNGYSCTCVPGYADVHCTTNLNECDSGPCQNDGTCNDGVNGYTCSCTSGWESTLCEVDTDECASNPCNDGNCTDQVDGYYCTCELGFIGTYCETNVDECESTPCQNGATCNDGRNQYTCTCVPGFIGTHCETNIDECVSEPCQNGGSCVDGVNGYTCSCVPGYVDTLCETNFDECGSSPCVNGATCVDHLNYYTCVCVPGYGGSLCITNIDECASNPCENNGTCTDIVNGFDCDCPNLTLGSTCMTNPCTPDPCLFDGTCEVDTTLEQDYMPLCTDCITGFSGRLCDIGPCENNNETCLNGGTCTNGVSGTGTDALAVGECECESGYRGDDCGNGDGTISRSGQQTEDTNTSGGPLAMFQQYPYAAIGVAAALVALCLLALIVFVRRRREKKKKEDLERQQREQEEFEAERAQRNTTFTQVGQSSTPGGGVTPTGGQYGGGGGGGGLTPTETNQAQFNNDMENFFNY